MKISRFCKICRILGVILLLGLVTEIAFGHIFPAIFKKTSGRPQITLEMVPELIPSESDLEAALRARESLMKPESERSAFTPYTLEHPSTGNVSTIPNATSTPTAIILEKDLLRVQPSELQPLEIKANPLEIDPDTPQITVECRFLTCPPECLSPEGFNLR